MDQEDRKAQPYAHFNLGRIAFQRNDFAKANAHFDESIRSAQQNQDPYLEAYAHRELGLLFQATHQASESRHSFQQALDLFEQLGIESEIEATRQLMADAVVDR